MPWMQKGANNFFKGLGARLRHSAAPELLLKIESYSAFRRLCVKPDLHAEPPTRKETQGDLAPSDLEYIHGLHAIFNRKGLARVDGY